MRLTVEITITKDILKAPVYAQVSEEIPSADFGENVSAVDAALDRLAADAKGRAERQIEALNMAERAKIRKPVAA